MKKKTIIIGSICVGLLALIAFLVVETNVGNEELSTTTSCDDITLSDSQVCMLINDFATVIDVEDDVDIYNATQLTTEFSNSFLVADLNGFEITVDGYILVEGEVYELALEVLSTDLFIDVELSKDESDFIEQVRTLHEDINFTVEGESEDGFYYFDYNNAAVKTDNTGSVVFYKYTDFIRNFKRYEIDGTVYYGYLERAEEGSYDNIDTDGCAHMSLVVLNEQYEEIDRVDYLLTNNDIDENHSIENHDYQILGLGHYIVTAYVATSVDNIPSELTSDGSGEADVVAAVFQEIKDGELVFEFNSTDYEELYALSNDDTCNNFGDDNYEDYVHMNSVIIDPSDNNYIVSLRSMNAVIKLDSETKEIIWILGGDGDMFGIDEEAYTSRQHYATISLTGSLTIYDNGRESEQSRIVEFVLDEENLEVLETNIYQIDGYYGSIRGSTIRLSEDEDIFLTAWGWTQDNGAFITEYNFSSDETIIEFYDGTDGNSKNYRVHKYDE